MFKGSIAALITPFTDEGEVDFEALKHLVDWHAQEGSDAIMCCGSTGEAPTLSSEEQYKVIKTAVEVARKRLPVIAGTGTYDTRKTVANTEKAKELGADGCLVVVPYYNRPTPEGCIAHYREINKVGLPMIVYHHPGRTGIRLSARHLVEISQLSSVAAIKDSTGSVDLIKEVKQMTDVPTLCGDDTLTYEMLECGAVGGVSIVANVIPKAWSEMVNSFLQGDLQRAKELDALYAPLYNSLVLEINPLGVKYAVSLLKKCRPHLRLPLLQPKEATKLVILKELSKIEGSALMLLK
jgi:4-hydroxy-tetrahydrodipicolinate synthase